MNPKYSIVIGTKDNFEKYLKPCLESIKQYTDMGTVEVIVVCNGCPDDKAEEYVKSLGEPFYLLSSKEPLGYPKANNWGMFDSSAAGTALRFSGDYVVLLNDDTRLLPQKTNEWLEILEKPFLSDPEVGITGPMKAWSEPAGREFMIFFCVMMSRKCVQKVGVLNEFFGKGWGEDTDYCIRAVAEGFKMVQVPKEERLTVSGKTSLGPFPIWHEGGSTINTDPEHNKLFKRNSLLLAKMYNPGWYRAALSNDSERVYFDDTEDIREDLFVREAARYKFAAANLKGKKILEIGCSSGYGLRYLPDGLDYTGIDYDQSIIDFANEHFAKPGRKFICADINEFEFEHYDTIIAYEVIEHLHKGRDIAQKLKEHCDTLLMTVPYREPPGLWGRHHVLHRLDENDFPGFEYRWVHEDGEIGGVPDHDHGMNLMIMKWERGKQYSIPQRVLAFVPTRNRYDSLALCVQAIANQTVRPHKIMIYDDGEHRDLRNDKIFKFIFSVLESKGIEWEVVFGGGGGQHHGHQRANTAGYPFVWRVDDDEVPNPNVLRTLLSHMTENTGAVGGSVVVPRGVTRGGSGRIEDIYHKPNIQWDTGTKVFEVDHLYSSFLYRAGIVDYRCDLSAMAHREETLFTHALKRKGYRLVVDQNAITYHYRQESGGIRDTQSQLAFEKDERLFKEQMEYWGYKLINLDTGLGDHLAFLNIVPALKRKYKKLIIGCCYPDVFYEHPDLTLISIAESRKWCDDNVYKWMGDREWEGSLVGAFQRMYGVTDEDIASAKRAATQERDAECEDVPALAESCGVGGR